MKIHCLGIGGIAISGLALMYHEKDHQVQGSDSDSSEITEQLQEKGVKVFIGHKEKNITKDIDKVIYSEAISADNVELQRAKALGIECLTGAEAIKEIAALHKTTIAVSGMHGKTTTSCMIAEILKQAGKDPSYIIGTKNGSHWGKSDYLVIEADDYKAKFLHYKPQILVLTNIEEEHLDFFRDLNHILEVFKQYVSQVKTLIIANKDDENIRKVVRGARCKVEFCGKLKIKLQVPGQHNQSNAALALAATKAVGVDEKTALGALSNYKGTWRRFQEKEVKIGDREFTLVSDYAHHPTEIKATLQGAREKYPKKEIWCIFQPHQHQRTFYLFDDFVKAFREAPLQKLIITDIYDVKGRESEEIKQKVSAQKLATAITKPYACYLPQEKIVNYLKSNLEGGEVVMIVGAGNIYNLAKQLSTSGN